MSEKIPIDNIIEKSMREIPDQNSSVDATDLILAGLMEQQKLKLEIAKLFISDKKYKTEISSMQRLLLPSMMQMADKPFESTERMLRKLGKTDKELKDVLESQRIMFLKQFLPVWLEMGIAKDRKGRIEDKDVISALVSAEQEIRMGQNANNNQNRI
jgi:hypothetical protein